MYKQKYIISLGSINTDIQLRIERWPNPGESVPGTNFLTTSGGKAANVAFLLHKLGLPVKLVARTGDDEWAGLARKSLEENGLNLQFTRALPGYATGVAVIGVMPDAEKGMLLAFNANDGWRPEDLADVEKALQEAAPGSLLVVNLEVSDFIVSHALELARKLGHTVILDPSPAGRMQAGFYSLADYITPNRAESELLTGRKIESLKDAFEVGDELVKKGTGFALIKLGKDGCAVIGQGIRKVIPAITVRAVDKTGAGDAFAGGLAAALFEGRAVQEAVRFANIASALTVTGYGSQPSYPFRQEIEKHFQPP